MSCTAVTRMRCYSAILAGIILCNTNTGPPGPDMCVSPATLTMTDGCEMSLRRAMTSERCWFAYGTAAVTSTRHFITGRPSRYRGATTTWLTALWPRQPSQ